MIHLRESIWKRGQKLIQLVDIRISIGNSSVPSSSYRRTEILYMKFNIFPVRSTKCQKRIWRQSAPAPRDTLAPKAVEWTRRSPFSGKLVRKHFSSLLHSRFVTDRVQSFWNCTRAFQRVFQIDFKGLVVYIISLLVLGRTWHVLSYTDFSTNNVYTAWKSRLFWINALLYSEWISFDARF